MSNNTKDPSRLKGKTKCILELTLKGVSDHEQAKKLNTTIGNVYKTKSLLKKRGYLTQSESHEIETVAGTTIIRENNSRTISTAGSDIPKVNNQDSHPEPKKAMITLIYERLDSKVPDIEIAKEFGLSADQFIKIKTDYLRIKDADSLVSFYQSSPGNIDSIIQLHNRMIAEKMQPPYFIEALKYEHQLRDVPELFKDISLHINDLKLKMTAIDKALKANIENNEKLKKDNSNLMIQNSTAQSDLESLRAEHGDLLAKAGAMRATLQGNLADLLWQDRAFVYALEATIYDIARNDDWHSVVNRIELYKTYDPEFYKSEKKEVFKNLMKRVLDKMERKLERMFETR
jgi:hypothetical protein